MSSLWTPGGERPVGRSSDGGTSAGGAELPPELADLSPEEQEQLARELAEVQARIVAAPAAEVVASHAVRFHELAVLHLAQEQPRFDQAAVAIDALQAVVEALGERLGENLPVLRDAVAQLQAIFVQRRRETDAASDQAGG